MYNILLSHCSQLPSLIFTPCHSSLSEQAPLLLSRLSCVCSLHLTSWTWMGVMVYLNKGHLSVATPLEDMSLHPLQWSAACSTSGISAALGAHPHPWWKVDGLSCAGSHCCCECVGQVTSRWRLSPALLPILQFSLSFFSFSQDTPYTLDRVL